MHQREALRPHRLEESRLELDCSNLYREGLEQFQRVGADVLEPFFPVQLGPRVNAQNESWAGHHLFGELGHAPSLPLLRLFRAVQR